MPSSSMASYLSRKYFPDAAQPMAPNMSPAGETIAASDWMRAKEPTRRPHGTAMFGSSGRPLKSAGRFHLLVHGLHSNEGGEEKILLGDGVGNRSVDRGARGDVHAAARERAAREMDRARRNRLGRPGRA